MDLLADIQAFIETHGITEPQFGEQSVNDKNLVPQLNGINCARPRRLWPETEARIRRYMATYRSATDEANAA